METNYDNKNSASLKKIVYEACYNPSCSEGVGLTLSIHETRKGAEVALEFHKHEELEQWKKECKEYPSARIFPFDYDQDWYIKETLLLP